MSDDEDDEVSLEICFCWKFLFCFKWIFLDFLKNSFFFFKEVLWKDCGENVFNVKLLVIKMFNVRKGRFVGLGIKFLEMLELIVCLIKWCYLRYLVKGDVLGWN